MTETRDTTAEKLERRNCEALDNILGIPFPVLDNGHIRVIDYMGTEDTIVQAARVSYGKGTKKASEDAGLLRYLLRHRHTTPFEMCEIMLHVRVPMDCWRQWIRHRTANVNEYSTRYSEAIDEKQVTQPDQWRSQSKDNKQGSGAYLDLEAGQVLSHAEHELHDQVTRVYHERLECGVAREQARKDLPLSTYTEAYWKIDLHNLLHFLLLRMDSHAQHEIRQYANVIGDEILSIWLPNIYNEFLERLDGMSFGDSEIKLLNSVMRDNGLWKDIGIDHGWLDEEGKPSKRSRIRDEIESKFERLGIDILPWNQ